MAPHDSTQHQGCAIADASLHKMQSLLFSAVCLTMHACCLNQEAKFLVCKPVKILKILPGSITVQLSHLLLCSEIRLSAVMCARFSILDMRLRPSHSSTSDAWPCSRQHVHALALQLARLLKCCALTKEASRQGTITGKASHV